VVASEIVPESAVPLLEYSRFLQRIPVGDPLVHVLHRAHQLLVLCICQIACDDHKRRFNQGQSCGQECVKIGRARLPESADVQIRDLEQSRREDSLGC